MGSESPSAVQSVPPTDGVELSARQHLSVDEFEIYVPKAAEVLIVPVQTLPLGILKKIGLLSSHEASCLDSATVTWISPVVVREKGPGPAPPLGSRRAPPPSRCGAAARAFLSAAVATCSSAPGGRSQCWLPVACSNLTAFKVLRKLMPHGHCPSPDIKWKTCQPARRPSLGLNVCFSHDAIIIHRDYIFLSLSKAGRGKKRVGHRRSLKLEAPPTLTQQTGLGTPAGPQSAQQSCGHSVAPRIKFQAACEDAGLAALRLRFGVERRARVALARLPDATLKTLLAGGLIDLEEHPAAARLCRKADQKKLSSRCCSTETSRNHCAEDLAGARGSGDREKGVAHYKGCIMEEPVLKKTRWASGGDGSTGRSEIVDRSTDKGEGGDLNTGAVMGGDLNTVDGDDLNAGAVDGDDLNAGAVDGNDVHADSVDGDDLNSGAVEGHDVHADAVDGDDLNSGAVDGDDLNAGAVEGDVVHADTVEGDDVHADTVEGDDVHADTVEGDDVHAGAVEGDDVHADTVEGDDHADTVEGDDVHADTVEGDDVHADTVEGDDVHADTVEGDNVHADTVEGDDVHADTGEGDDLHAGGVCSIEGMERNGGEGAECAGEGHSGVDAQGLDQWYQPAASLGYNAEFDFDLLARDERISRIRARLSEKQAALQRLARLPL